MENFYEIMDFCGFDLQKADRMVKDNSASSWMKETVEEAMAEVGLETLSAKPAET